MRFSPKSQEELAQSGGGGFEPFPSGEYDIEVLNAVDDISKSTGAEQIKLTVAIYNTSGAKRQVFEYLSSSPKAVWRIKEFADCVGMTDAYERGEMHPEDLIGRTGRARIAIRRSAEYGDKNAVANWLSAKPVGGMTFGAPKRTSTAARADDLEDQIPFAPSWQ